VISHDRWFLDRICTHILAFEGNSDVYYFEGGFSEYEENEKTFRWRLNTKTFEIQKTNQKLILVLYKKKGCPLRHPFLLVSNYI
jgi:ATPase subunit of ABC transporter with duplicated ATPase domains